MRTTSLVEEIKSFKDYKLKRGREKFIFLRSQRGPKEDKKKLARPWAQDAGNLKAGERTR